MRFWWVKLLAYIKNTLSSYVAESVKKKKNKLKMNMMSWRV